MFKLAHIVICKKILRISAGMTRMRSFYICPGDNTSKTFTPKNGVPQGSVIAPTLINVYLSDVPGKKSLKFEYGNDWGLSNDL